MNARLWLCAAVLLAGCAEPPKPVDLTGVRFQTGLVVCTDRPDLRTDYVCRDETGITRARIKIGSAALYRHLPETQEWRRIGWYETAADCEQAKAREREATGVRHGCVVVGTDGMSVLPLDMQPNQR